MAHTSHIANHYNQVAEQTRDERNDRRTIRVDNFQNAMKARLIEDYGPEKPDIKILDVASGKSSDYWKFQSTYPHHSLYAGLDISPNSIAAARDRLQTKRSNAEILLGVADMTRVETWHHIPYRYLGQFDIVNLQFAIHYACDQEQNVRNLLINVSKSLAPGGILLGTTVNIHEVVTRLQQGPMFGNSLYYVEWDGARLGRPNYEHHAQNFGYPYMFHLDGRVHLQEFLVPFDRLCHIAKEYQLHMHATHDVSATSRACLMEMISSIPSDLTQDYEGWKQLLKTTDPRRWLYEQWQHPRPRRSTGQLTIQSLQQLTAHPLYKLVQTFSLLNQEEFEIVSLYKTFVFHKQ